MKLFLSLPHPLRSAKKLHELSAQQISLELGEVACIPPPFWAGTFDPLSLYYSQVISIKSPPQTRSHYCKSFNSFFLSFTFSLVDHDRDIQNTIDTLRSCIRFLRHFASFVSLFSLFRLSCATVESVILREMLRDISFAFTLKYYVKVTFFVIFLFPLLWSTT